MRTLSLNCELFAGLFIKFDNLWPHYTTIGHYHCQCAFAIFMIVHGTFPYKIKKAITNRFVGVKIVACDSVQTSNKNERDGFVAIRCSMYGGALAFPQMKAIFGTWTTAGASVWNQLAWHLNKSHAYVSHQ